MCDPIETLVILGQHRTIISTRRTRAEADLVRTPRAYPNTLSKEQREDEYLETLE